MQAKPLPRPIRRTATPTRAAPLQDGRTCPVISRDPRRPQMTRTRLAVSKADNAVHPVDRLHLEYSYLL